MRTRKCPQCGHRFATTELIGNLRGDLPLLPPLVLKKSGKTQPFDRNKLMRSLAVAVRKSRRQQIPLEDIATDMEQVVTAGDAAAPLTTRQLGARVMHALREHDAVA